MVSCPLCHRHLYEAYLHIRHNYLICLHCRQLAKRYNQQYQFIYVLPSTFIINHQLLEFTCILQIEFQGVPPLKVFEEKLVEKIINRNSAIKEDSLTLTISTEEGELSKQQEKVIQYSTAQILDKCKSTVGSTVRVIGEHMTPFHQKFNKTKTSIEESSKHIQQKMMGIKAKYVQISSEMPPIKEFAKQSLKRGIGTLFSKLF